MSETPDLHDLSINVETFCAALRSLGESAEASGEAFRRLTAEHERFEREWLDRQTPDVRARYQQLRAEGEYVYEAMERSESGR